MAATSSQGVIRQGRGQDDGAGPLASPSLPATCPAEHLVLDVPGRHAALHQRATDFVHERHRAAQVIHRVIGQADLRDIHQALEDFPHRGLALAALLEPQVAGGVRQRGDVGQHLMAEGEVFSL